MRVSLRIRLGLWAALATGLAVLLVSAGLFFAVSRLMQAEQFDRARAAASAAQEQIESLARNRGDDLLASILAPDSSPVISVADLEHIAAADSSRSGLELRLSNALGQSVSTAHFPAGLSQGLRPGEYQFQEHMVLVRPLRGAAALLTVTTDARAISDVRRAFARVLAWLLPLALLLALLVGWLVAGRLVRPLAALERAARQVGDGGDLRRPLPGAGQQDELSRLALALQQSFGRLADSREREQAFLRAAAHDLRSPLAALQARVDGTLARERDVERYRHDLREIGRDLTRLSTLANHLLLLARDPGAVAHAPVPLRDLAAEAVDRARELAPEADVDLLAPQPLMVEGDRVLLGQAIWNLTMNAVRHAPKATVTVIVRAVSGQQVQVSVRDDGPGVLPEVLARLGEAFYRPDTSRTGEGHGLGLALASRVAHLHGGQLLLESQPGQGFTATLLLPVAPVAAAPGSATL